MYVLIIRGALVVDPEYSRKLLLIGDSEVGNCNLFST